MAEQSGGKRDTTSIKMFFLVLGAIAAYQLVNWMRGAPEWREFTYEPGAFVAAVAGELDERTLSESYPFGEVEFRFLTFARGDVQYAIAFGDIPVAISPDSALVSARRALVEKVQGEITETTTDSLDGRPARRVQIRAADDSALFLLSVYKEGCLYQLMAGGQTEDLSDSADLQRFFSSFRLVD